MVITVFGLGFVGLTTALGFAHYGDKVYGIDVNKERTDIIKSGKLPFYEPGMGEILEKELGNNFFVTEDIKSAVIESDVIYYCVGTPYGESGSADLTYLFSAIDSTLNAIEDKKFRVLVAKSTIPPTTTTERVVPYIVSKGFKDGVDIGIANNPEFLREGYCWDDFINADRIVLGVDDEKSSEILRALYEKMQIPIFCVSRNTGEFVKYLSNTLLATLISYSNEMSLAADAFGGIDISNAFKILHMDKRWGNCNMKSYAYPGCGYGGYCLPKDTNAFYAQALEKGFDAKILKNVIELNDNMPKNAALRVVKESSKSDVLGFLGLSFKPNSDDVRDTASAKIIKELLDIGYKKIIAYDPIANEEFDKLYKLDVEYKNSMQEILESADVIVITTAWSEFKKLDEMDLEKTIVDLRYML